MIVGPVGSGKSSLVEAILGEMTTLTGTIEVHRYVGSYQNAYSSTSSSQFLPEFAPKF